MERKTLLTHGLQIVRFNHLSRRARDSNICAVQVLDNEVDTGQGLIERDLLFEKDISTLPLELFVGLFLHNNDDIARLNAGCLISLTVECVLALVRSTLVDHRVKDLLLFLYLFAFTCCAFFSLINDLTLSTAVVTRALRLGVHAWSELCHPHNHTATTTGCALLNSAFSSSSALTNFANSLSVYGNFRGLSVENLFEGAFEWVHDRLAFLRSTRPTTASTTHAEHLLKEATTTHAATAASFFDSL